MEKNKPFPFFESINDWHKALSTGLQTFHEDFHIFRYEEVMKNLVLETPYYKDAFFHITFATSMDATLVVNERKFDCKKGGLFFFIAPEQLIHWKRGTENWKGYVMLIKPKFITYSIQGSQLLKDLMLFEKEAINVMQVDSENENEFVGILEKILHEYRNEKPMKFEVIRSYIKVLLILAQRTSLKITSGAIHKRYWINFGKKKFNAAGKGGMEQVYKLSISYHGNPRLAKNPPWDGGWIFTKDAQGRPWMSVACQGLGASVWYPCKDYQGDEPDMGASITMNVPDSVVAVANGRLKEKSSDNGTTSWTWIVEDPINNYNLIPYIGKYVEWKETYDGEKGKLDCDYWVLDYNLEKAKEQFKQVPMMLKAFEHWFGPYPFYEDGYKLIEAPHLGMEHQSAVAYGNKFANGYLGRDLSGSAAGWGLKWDFIIVHESGHEWFANNITSVDIADMWVHEGFTNYSETLFTEYYYGKEAGSDYVIGTRKLIRNNKPIIGPYGVNKEGSGDMYYKGGNMLHTIRYVINDDEKFRSILRGLNKDFYHQVVTSKQVEEYMAKKSGKDLSKIFDQYLRTTMIPVLEYKFTGDNMYYRWTNCVHGFNMPVKLDGIDDWLKATTEWKTVAVTEGILKDGLKIDRNFYITVKKVE